MSKLFKKFNKKSTAEIRKELARAHLIIALLSMALIVLLSLGAIQPVTFDATLSAICVILLSLIAFISTCVSFTLFSNKK
jgi:hypothetical protein